MQWHLVGTQDPRALRRPARPGCSGGRFSPGPSPAALPGWRQPVFVSPLCFAHSQAAPTPDRRSCSLGAARTPQPPQKCLMFPCLLKQHTAIGSQRTPGTAGPPGTREGLESVCREDKSWFKAYKRKAHPAAPAPRLPASKPPLRARAARTRRRGTRPCFPRSTPWPPVAAPPPCPQPRAPRPSALLRAAAAPPRRCSPKRTAVVGRVGRASLCASAHTARHAL